MSRDRWAQSIVASLEKDFKLQVTEVRKNRHLVIKGELNGKPFSWILSTTPSDVHADNQALRGLRRELRKCGVDEPPRFNVRGSSGITMSDQAWDALRSWETHCAIADSKT
jgi:hypothetical protein